MHYVHYHYDIDLEFDHSDLQMNIHVYMYMRVAIERSIRIWRLQAVVAIPNTWTYVTLVDFPAYIHVL